mmetsp:Transcript_3572/g.2599  ORF Transcript_3572/g.2599 Transcript_3572/m.2599 type:complete len:151 (-) Transcript_3572:966-1418(-)
MAADKDELKFKFQLSGPSRSSDNIIKEAQSPPAKSPSKGKKAKKGVSQPTSSTQLLQKRKKKRLSESDFEDEDYKCKKTYLGATKKEEDKFEEEKNILPVQDQVFPPVLEEVDKPLPAIERPRRQAAINKNYKQDDNFHIMEGEGGSLTY